MLMNILSVYFRADPLAAVVSHCQISLDLSPRVLGYGGLLSTQKRGGVNRRLQNKNFVLGIRQISFFGISVTALLMGSFPTYFFLDSCRKTTTNY